MEKYLVESLLMRHCLGAIRLLVFVGIRVFIWDFEGNAWSSELAQYIRWFGPC